MRRLRLVLSTFFLALLGLSCTGLPNTSVPTPYPTSFIPTIIGLTVQAGHTPINTPLPSPQPAETQPASLTPPQVESTSTTEPTPTAPAFNPSPTASLPPSATSTIDLSATPTLRPTRTPTITRTPTMPNADIQISRPGPMSRVISPINLIANLHTIPSGSYHVEIWIEPLQPGEDARLLFREVKNLISNPRDWIYLDNEIEFELSRVSEFAQLRLSVFDQYGRPVSVNSLDLVLLSMGASMLTPTGDLAEPIVIQEPTLNHLIQGGTVIVSGLVKPSEKSMLIQLVTVDGTVVGTSDIFVTPAPDGSYVPFSIDLPYQVSAATWVRLEVSESNTRIPGIEHLTSVEVFLSP